MENDWCHFVSTYDELSTIKSWHRALQLAIHSTQCCRLQFRILVVGRGKQIASTQCGGMGLANVENPMRWKFVSAAQIARKQAEPAKRFASTPVWWKIPGHFTSPFHSILTPQQTSSCLSSETRSVVGTLWPWSFCRQHTGSVSAVLPVVISRNLQIEVQISLDWASNTIIAGCG